MKECLHCKKEYEAKRDSSKFCSVNCRVKFNRANGSKNKVTGIQAQVLYNAMLEMVEKITDFPSPKVYDSERLPIAHKDEPPMYLAKPTVSQYDAYFNEIKAVRMLDDIPDLVKIIKADTDLPKWQQDNLVKFAIEHSKTFDF